MGGRVYPRSIKRGCSGKGRWRRGRGLEASVRNGTAGRGSGRARCSLSGKLLGCLFLVLGNQKQLLEGVWKIG